MAYLNYAGCVYDERELEAAKRSIDEFTLVYGNECISFEKQLSTYIGMLHSYTVNSGSSANLVALSALNLNRGDEVIVPAVSFPTTLAPIIQLGLKPVFIDTQLGYYNASYSRVLKAISKKTRAVIIAHILGNPFDLHHIESICKLMKIPLINDCCDALNSKFNERNVGSYGDISTHSFYASHNMSMGQGGLVSTNNKEFAAKIDSLRAWGKETWCYNVPSRFDTQSGKLPYGYDRKFVFTNIGYNLKPLEVQCAIGNEQFKKLDSFVASRKRNFKILDDFFSNYEDLFILPKSLPESDTVWFAYPLTVKTRKFTRNEICQHLEANGIETRPLFGGNLLRQPAFMDIKHRVSGSLKNSDIITENSFYLGVYPGLSEENMDYITKKLLNFLN